MSSATISCFLSHASADAEFCDKLNRDLKRYGIPTWYAPANNPAMGAEIRLALDQALEEHGFVLVVISRASIVSDWVQKEVETAFARERRDSRKRRIIIPIKIDNAIADVSSGWPADLQNMRQIGDFRGWRESDAYEESLKRLLRQLQSDNETDAQLPIMHSTHDSRRADTLRISDKLPGTGPLLFGRERELRQLDDAWNNPNTHLVSLVAWGGFGKTAVVNEWLNQLQKRNYCGAKDILTYSFNGQGSTGAWQTSADPFLEEALDFFRDPDPQKGSTGSKGQRLTGLLRDRKTVLVLDGLEVLQDLRDGRLKDPGLHSLLSGLGRQSSGLCVLTTHKAVHELRHLERTSMLTIDLEELSDEAGADYLQQLGVDGRRKDLEQASRDFGGHALALTLLGS